MNFATKDISGEQIVNMFEYATSEQLNFLKITPSYNVPINKKFSKNWLSYLKPNDFSNQLQLDYESDCENTEDGEPIIKARKKKTINNK